MIPALTLTIGLVGLALFSVLVARILATNAPAQLKRSRAKDAGFTDLLNYAAMVDDGVIVGKDGSLMAAWLFEGEDSESATDAQREGVSYTINQALASLGSGWMIHVDAVRRPAPSYPAPTQSDFPDPVSAAIDEERRRLFESQGTLYETVLVLTLTYLPPLLIEAKFVELMFDDDTTGADSKSRTLGLIDQFQRECRNVESRLTGALKLTRLNGVREISESGELVTHDQLLRWVQFCATGINHPVVLPSNPMYLDTIIGAQELWTGVVPRIGRNYVQVVAVDGFPLESTPGVLSALAEQPTEYRWSSRFIFMDTHEAVSHLERFRKKWRQKIRGFFDQVFQTNTGAIDEDAIAMVSDASAAMADVNSGLVAQGYYTSVVVLMDEDRARLEASARLLEKAIQRRGFGARTETINTLEAFLGSLPGHGVQNIRRPLINTLNLADFLPTSTIWTGEASAPCPQYPSNAPALLYAVTSGRTPYRLNLHVRDLGHALMFGPTRAGKSTHLALIALQLMRYQAMSVFCFDKGLSMYPTTKAVGGSHFSVAADDSQLAFCPLQFLDTPGDRAWALEWIDTLLALNGVVTTPAQRNEVGSALMSLHQSGARTLSEFTLTIQDERIRDALRQYTVDGVMGHLLDAEEDGLSLARFTTFEIEQLMGLGEKFVLPVLLYLFRRIERALLGQPTVVIIDEAWIALGHPVFRAKLRDWLKSYAKKNCALLLATHSVVDAAKSGILETLVESTATRIFLPNRDAREPDTAALYARMGLNPRQIDIIAHATPKRHYYAVSEAGRRLYELALGPLALSFVGATDLDSVAQVRALEAKHGRDWVHEWLARRGLQLSDYGVMA